MGRPPSCHCKCGGSTEIPPPPPEKSAFFTIIFQDEAHGAYCCSDTTEGIYVADLIELRKKSQTIGRCDMAFMHVEKAGRFGSELKPTGRDDGGVDGFPEEVIYIKSNVKRNTITSADREALKHITEQILRGKYNCFTVYIDNSGSMKEPAVRSLIDEWYWNISTNESSHTTYQRYIVDSNGDPNPLPSCLNGGGNKSGNGFDVKANGCVYEIINGNERWLQNAANGSQAIYDAPGLCASRPDIDEDEDGIPDCDCTTGLGWPELCAVFMDRNKVPTTVNFNVSWIKAGTFSEDDTDDDIDNPAVFVELKDQFGNVSNSEFKADIMEAFAVWKAALENACSWLTVTFTDIGDETITTLRSTGGRGRPGDSTGTYKFSDYPGANIGDIRVGMHTMAKASVLAHAYYPGAVLGVTGNHGGDMHFDYADRWRRDGQVVANAFSIKMVAVHEFGHALGIGHLSDPNTIMYSFAKGSSTDYDTEWADGVIGDTTTYNALKELYCGV